MMESKTTMIKFTVQCQAYIMVQTTINIAQQLDACHHVFHSCHLFYQQQVLHGM